MVGWFRSFSFEFFVRFAANSALRQKRKKVKVDSEIP